LPFPFAIVLSFRYVVFAYVALPFPYALALSPEHKTRAIPCQLFFVFHYVACQFFMLCLSFPFVFLLPATVPLQAFFGSNSYALHLKELFALLLCFAYGAQFTCTCFSAIATYCYCNFAT
jgi:hypothetical protein